MGTPQAEQQATVAADAPATDEPVLEDDVESDDSILIVEEIDTSQLQKLPVDHTLALLTEIEIPLDERAHEETGLLYQVFDLPPGLRFVKGAIVGRPPRTRHVYIYGVG